MHMAIAITIIVIGYLSRFYLNQPFLYYFMLKTVHFWLYISFLGEQNEFQHPFLLDSPELDFCLGMFSFCYHLICSWENAYLKSLLDEEILANTLFSIILLAYFWYIHQLRH